MKDERKPGFGVVLNHGVRFTVKPQIKGKPISFTTETLLSGFALLIYNSIFIISF
jgi:hypothetical protein